MLALTRHGPETGRPLIIAHGLFGSGRNWGVIARRLAADRPVLCVDMRNHGDSPWYDDHDYPALARDLAEVIAAHGGQADVLGHSMGGKAAMVLALHAPERVARLIVADIAPVAYGHTQRPLIRAMEALDLAGLTLRSEADARLAMQLRDPGVRAFLLQSLDLRSQPPHWRLNLRALDAGMEQILGWPAGMEPGQIAPFAGPALFVTGAQSDYVAPAHHARIRALFPAARFSPIAGAGHWLHADRPREFVEAVSGFLTA